MLGFLIVAYLLICCVPRVGAFSLPNQATSDDPFRSVWDVTFDPSGCQVMRLSIDTVPIYWVGWQPDTFNFSFLADL